MGKGDIKTRRGKLFRGTYGKKRPGKAKKHSLISAEKAQDSILSKKITKEPVRTKRPIHVTEPAVEEQVVEIKIPEKVTEEVVIEKKIPETITEEVVVEKKEHEPVIEKVITEEKVSELKPKKVVPEHGKVSEPKVKSGKEKPAKSASIKNRNTKL